MKWTLLFWLLPVFVCAQDLNETFDGPDLPTDWNGTNEVFEILDGELHLLDTDVVNTFSYLSGDFATSGETEWTIYIRQEIPDPSSNNHSRWYLQSNAPDLTSNLSGYFVQIGGFGSGSTDDVSLFRQDPGSTEGTKIIDGIDATALNADFRLRVTRSADSEWTLERLEPGEDWILEGIATDATYPSGPFAGVYCKYTSSNKDAFFFDNFTIDPLFIDTEAPSISNAVVNSTNEVCIELSEGLDENSLNPSNFEVVGIGAAVAVNQSAENSLLLCLEFADDFESEVDYVLNVGSITDLAGNSSPASSLEFSFVATSPGLIIINEIMADSEATESEPVLSEFVELYNTSNSPVSLGGWTWSDANDSNVPLGPISIEGNSYLILCAIEDIALFTGFGDVLGLASWPSLNNDDETLTLRDQAGSVIDQITYQKSWYDNSLKAEGGWTLERINAENLCNTGDNWTSCIAEAQATPGMLNSVDGLFEDLEAPVVTGLSVILPNQILLSYSEFLDPAISSETSSYEVSPVIGEPVSAFEIENDILLSFDLNFQEGVFYDLLINGISDCTGNLMETQTLQFAIPRPAEKFDVLINEIYADNTIPEEFETAELDLPKAEYVELFNRSDKAIDLGTLLFRDAVDTTSLGNYLLLPGAYVVLCAEANLSKFTNRNIPALGCTPFPTLNDTEDDLELYRNDWLSIHAASYNRSIFESEFKVEGGWSYELVDPNNPCGGNSNWAEATFFEGGTPGFQNSADAANLDETKPRLIRGEAIDPFTVHLVFDEFIDDGTEIILSNFSMSGFNIESASYLNSTTVALEIDPAMELGTIYTAQVSGQTDCVGNTIEEGSQAQIGLTNELEEGDIVINEILFNPPTDGVDFVELYNTSNKVLDLSGWFVANDPDPDDEIDEIANLKSISVDQYSFYPDSYIVLASDPQAVQEMYASCRDLSTIEFISVPLPTYRTDAGTVAITDLTASIFLDRVSYNEDWHFQLLDEEKGVSIERINPLGPSQDPNNWQSASTGSCFGTPGNQNSQFYNGVSLQDDLITVEPTVFSPDNDGFQDVAIISYEFDETGFTANVGIYDSRGRRIIDIAKSEIVGASGSWKWDGIDKDGAQAPIGIYVVYLEAFQLDGTVIHTKETIVLGKQLN